MKILIEDWIRTFSDENARFEISVPNANSENERKYFWGENEYCIEKLQNKGIFVESVSSYVTHEISCSPYQFHNDDDGDTTFDVVFSSEEMRIIEQLADGWFMDPTEVVHKIVKEYLKRIEDEVEYE